jgi:hypothetical protein
MRATVKGYSYDKEGLRVSFRRNSKVSFVLESVASPLLRLIAAV